MKLIPIRRYSKATAAIALLLCMASSFSSLRVSADQYSRYLAEDGGDKVTAQDSDTEQVKALDTDSQQAAAPEAGSEEVTAAEQAGNEIKATVLEETDLEIDEAVTQADGLDEEVALLDYIYLTEYPHMSMATEPPVLAPTTGKGYYSYYSKGKGGPKKSKSKSKKHKSKGKGEGAYYDDEYYVEPGYSKGKGTYEDDEYYVVIKGKGKGKGYYYYHVETTAPEMETPTDVPAEPEDPSADEPTDPSFPSEEGGDASQLPTTLPSTIQAAAAGSDEYAYKASKHKESQYYYTEPEYVYIEPEEPVYVYKVPEHDFQKPVYHYPVYRSKSMKSHKMKSSAKGYYYYGDEGKGKGYYPTAPTAAKGKGKGIFPSPTPPAKHQTPSPDASKWTSPSQDVGDQSLSPNYSPPPASIPAQSIPGVGTDSTGETITMADYTLSYELTGPDAPTSAMQLELEKVTADYVKDFFETNFAMSSVIHFTGATTSLLSSSYPDYPTPPAKVNFQTELDFAASSGHPQVAESESGPSQYDDALRIAFEGPNAESYLQIVKLLPPGNVYRTATSVLFEHGSFSDAKVVTIPSPQTAGTISTNTVTETATAGIPGAPNASTSTTTTSGINTAGIAAAAGAGFFVLLVAGMVVLRNRRSEEDGRVHKYLNEDDCGHITVAEETYTGASSNDSQSCTHQSSPSRDFGRSLIGLPATEEEATGREHSSSVGETVSDKGDDDEGSEDSCSCVLEDEEV